MVKWVTHSDFPINGEFVMVAVMRPWQALWAIIHQYQGVSSHFLGIFQLQSDHFEE